MDPALVCEESQSDRRFHSSPRRAEARRTRRALLCFLQYGAATPHCRRRDTSNNDAVDEQSNRTELSSRRAIF
jgi:hypothetical protein